MQKHYPISRLEFEKTAAEIGMEFEVKMNRNTALNKKVIDCVIDVLEINRGLCDRLEKAEARITRVQRNVTFLSKELSKHKENAAC